MTIVNINAGTFKYACIFLRQMMPEINEHGICHVCEDKTIEFLLRGQKMAEYQEASGILKVYIHSSKAIPIYAVFPMNNYTTRRNYHG